MEWKAILSAPVESTGRSILERVLETSRRFNLHSLNREIAVCEGLFGQEKVIDVAILGQFKAGKSSFINSLMEQDVLPVGVTPVTTVVTRLRYEKEPRAVITHFDGNRNLLDRNIETVLRVKLSSPAWDLNVPEPAHPDVAFTKVFDFHFDLLWFVIPMFVFKGVFERHFIKMIPGIAQTNLSRLAYQWEVRINKAIEKIRDQALDYVQKELSTIDALLSQSEERSTEIRNTIKDLYENLQTLEHDDQ